MAKHRRPSRPRTPFTNFDSLKELRETERWLKLMERAKIVSKSEKLAPLLNETDQLIRIFVTSISTAEKRRNP